MAQTGKVQKGLRRAVADSEREKRNRNIAERFVGQRQPQPSGATEIEIDVGSDDEYSNVELAPPPPISNILNETFEARNNTTPRLTSGTRN